MDLGGLLEKSVTGLGIRFGLVGLLPSALLVTFCAFLVLGGAPGKPPQLELVFGDIAHSSAADVLLLAAAAFTIAIILQPFQTFFIRLLEGYWGSSGFSKILSEFFQSRHRRKRDRLLAGIERLEKLANAQKASNGGLGTKAGILADRLARSYPANKFLPTMLGNVLRAAEENAGALHGLDVVTVWPFLYAVLPQRTAALVDDQRNQLDVAARLCVTSGMATVVSLCLLYKHGWWLLVPAATLLLSWISYRGAIISAFSYGLGIRLAVELHRFDLLTAMRLPLPEDRLTEVIFNRNLSDFLRQGKPENFKYHHIT